VALGCGGGSDVAAGAGASSSGSVLVVIASVLGDAGVNGSALDIGVDGGGVSVAAAGVGSGFFLLLLDSGWAVVDFGKPLSLVAATGVGAGTSVAATSGAAVSGAVVSGAGTGSVVDAD
jgi:hypothetical protein